MGSLFNRCYLYIYILKLTKYNINLYFMYKINKYKIVFIMYIMLIDKNIFILI